MNNLLNYVLYHTDAMPLTENRNGAVAVGLFKVATKNNPQAEVLRTLIGNCFSGLYNTRINPLDGKEHNYIELGTWIGSQDYALRFMGLCEAVGLSKTLTPRVMVGETLTPHLEQRLIGKGLIIMLEKQQAEKQLGNGAPLACLLGNL